MCFLPGYYFCAEIVTAISEPNEIFSDTIVLLCDVKSFNNYCKTDK